MAKPESPSPSLRNDSGEPSRAPLDAPRFFLASGEHLTVAPSRIAGHLDVLHRSGERRHAAVLRIPDGLRVLDAIVARRADGTEVVVTADVDLGDPHAEIAWWSAAGADGFPARHRIWRGEPGSVVRSLLVWNGVLLALDVRARVIHRFLDKDRDGIWETPAGLFAKPDLLHDVAAAELRNVAADGAPDPRQVAVIEYEPNPGTRWPHDISRAVILLDEDGDGVADRRREQTELFSSPDGPAS